MIKDILNTFKKPLIILGIILAVFFALKVILPFVNNATANQSPIVEIKADNDLVYAQSDKISPSDFTVTAIHESGKENTLDPGEYTINRKHPDRTGKSTPVEITLKSDKSIKVKVKVKNEREKLISFECGFPDVKDVQAVLYSNGELCFEGKGDILRYEDGAYPWMDYETMDDDPITAVSFEEGITPAYLDGYFANVETLTYVSNIPNSVESLNGTFTGCIALEKLPDLSGCTNLQDMTEAFMECTSLTMIPTLPANVRTIDNMCNGCILLQSLPDLSGATGVVSAMGTFSGCSVLTEAEVPPKTKNMSEMFSSCINLKEMPEIPGSVTNMESAFADDNSLSVVTSIPASVKNLNNAFAQCSKLTGTFRIDAEPEDYQGMFTDAAIATDLDLTGSSTALEVMALTAGDGTNITVNGSAPNPEAQYEH